MTAPPAPPSPFVARHGPLLAAAARLGPVADVACGRGRHARFAADLGARVIAIDRSAEALRSLLAVAAETSLPIAPVRTDLELGHGLPLRAASCGAVIVTRYLHRPLAPALAALLRPGGLLLYETFTIHQRELGSGPRCADFLLEDGELPRLFPSLDVLHFAQTRSADACLAQLAARRTLASASPD